MLSFQQSRVSAFLAPHKETALWKTVSEESYMYTLPISSVTVQRRQNQTACYWTPPYLAGPCWRPSSLVAIYTRTSSWFDPRDRLDVEDQLLMYLRVTTSSLTNTMRSWWAEWTAPMTNSTTRAPSLQSISGSLLSGFEWANVGGTHKRMCYKIINTAFV